MNIHIPNPCHEDWNRMQPEEQGRFCGVCSKTVMDFTGWEPDAIMAWLQARAGQKVCGRFTATQINGAEEPAAVNWPRQIALSALSWGKKVAAVIVVVFGLTASSCNDGTADAAKKPAVKDTANPGELTGAMVPFPDLKDSVASVMVPLVTPLYFPVEAPVVTMGIPALSAPTSPEPMIVGELAVPDSLLPLHPLPPPPVKIDSSMMIVGQLLEPPTFKNPADSLPADSLKRIP